MFMNKLLMLLICMLQVACGGKSDSSARTSPELTSTDIALASSLSPFNLIPYPQELTVIEGQLALSETVKLVLADNTPASTQAITKLLNHLQLSVSDKSTLTIRFNLDPSLSLTEEGYQLRIDEGIEISAVSDVGLFYGVQTLRQLLPAQASANYVLPKVDITDQPRYAWRGSMIDVARHFISIDYLKRHVERMALFKLNKLHLHLTDDQGWRIEIKAYPKLTSIGATTQVNGSGGGFYSQEQMRDLVAFAQLHGVEIIPEIDMPGHIQAAIASYNELACEDAKSFELYEGMQVGWSSLCLDKPEIIYPFVTSVLSELVDIFPTQYIHIGGDEIEHVRYAEFIERTDNILQNLGRKTIAWEEASKGELHSDSLLQLWNDEYDIQSAIDRNIHLVLSPCSYTYFDHGNVAGQENTFDWCTKDGVSLARVYSFKPENYPLVVGIEAPLWTEMVVDEAGADNRLWPRLSAIAEVAWSAEKHRDFAQFKQRLSVIKTHLDALQINYYGK